MEEEAGVVAPLFSTAVAAAVPHQEGTVSLEAVESLTVAAPLMTGNQDCLQHYLYSGNVTPIILVNSPLGEA